MRQKTDDRGLLELGLQFRDQCQRLGVGVVHVKDDQRRLLVTILFDVIEKVFFCLDELDLYVELARGLLNLGHEKQVIDEGEYSGAGIFL